METGGTAEILGPGGGLLVRDAQGLADALARIVGQASLREELRAAALARAAAYAPETLVPRYEAVYRRLL